MRRASRLGRVCFKRGSCLLFGTQRSALNHHPLFLLDNTVAHLHSFPLHYHVRPYLLPVSVYSRRGIQPAFSPRHLRRTRFFGHFTLGMGNTRRPDPRKGKLCQPIHRYCFESHRRLVNSRFTLKSRLNTPTADDKTFLMRGDDVRMVSPAERGRNSVRISSSAAYSDSIIVLDLLHMPTGCATWPAL